MEIGDRTATERAMAKLEESLLNSGLSAKKKSDVMLEAKQIMVELKRKEAQKSFSYLNINPENGSSKRDEEMTFFEEYLSPPGKGENPSIPGASAAVRLRRDPARGRHAVAARDVDVGEVLISDEPVVHLLLPQYGLSHCAGCAVDVHGAAVVPCPGCVSVVYCSQECLENTQKRYLTLLINKRLY